MNIALIVLNWNGTDDTLRCIKSLVVQSYQDFDVIIVDNGSRESIEKLRELVDAHGNIILLENDRNYGFAGGVNTGIRYCIEQQYKNIVLFNNDAVADKNLLKNMVEAAKSSKAAIITGLLLNDTGDTIDSTAEQYSIWGMPFPRNRGDKKDRVRESGHVFGATGGASLYRTSLFKEIGLFDESFFAYYEDVDISFRAQLAGHKIYFTNKAIAYHKQGATSKKIPGFAIYQTFKNIPLLYTKNVPTGLLVPVGVRLLLLYWLVFANAVRKGNGLHALKGWLASIGYFWTRAIWLRIGIQRRKKVSTDYINSIIYHDLPPDQTGMRKFRKVFTGKP